MKQSIEELLPRPSVMGVVNVTPDSFSDGGAFLHPQAAIAEARGMLDEGAAIVDVGGESTRPGSEGVSVEEELDRVEPVLAALFDVPVSIDTSKAEVARRALEAGAVLVNDVTALRGEPALAGVVADSDACLCLMHMLGEPRTMQEGPRYDDVVSEVKAFLEERLEFATEAGIAEERICLDPGIGFGKTVEHNLELLARLDEIVALGRPVLVGASRKRFLGRLLGDEEALTGPVSAGVALAALAYERGATIFRVHDVREHVEALAVARALEEVTLMSQMEIEIDGLELIGFHGATRSEQETGQRFLFDVWLVAHDAGVRSDRLDDTIDYTKVVACIREISDSRRFNLIEALAAAIADTLVERFDVSRVRVRVRKPEVQLDAPAAYTAATIEREHR